MQANVAELELELRALAKEEGWTQEDIVKTLRWIVAPTIRPIVPMKEFLESDQYMGVKKPDGTSILFPEVIRELEEMNNGEYDEVVLTGSIGSAKCLGAGTPILMFDGTIKPVEQVQVGDTLLGPDSQPRIVKSTASGVDDLYRVNQMAGNSYVVNSAHILSLQYTATMSALRKKGQVLNIGVRDYLALPESHRNLLKGYRPAIVEFESVPVYDPYLLGLWLGDGTSGAPSFTSMDHEIVSYLQLVARREGVMLMPLEDKRGNQAQRYTFGSYGGRVGQNPVRNWLKSRNLFGNKHVPHDYLTASVQDRRLLLAGLIDTDGSLSNGIFVISQKREHLADSICYLSHSLGLRATKTVNVIGGTPYYRVFISGELSTIPTRIPRKKAKPRRQAKSVTRWGVTVEPAGRGAYYGFELEGPDRLFMLGDFTVTHNTTCALYSIAYQLYLLSCYESPHELYGLDPSSEIVFIFQSLRMSAAKEVDYERFRAMIEKCKYFKEYFPFDKDLTSELKFPHRIYVRPVSSKDTAAIGQNVFGGIIDEINFMQMVEASKNNPDGGTYDQAKALYDTIAKRRKSRFSTGGALPGLLCMVSSKRYPGQFTDRKTKEANADIERTGKTSIYIYDKRMWDIKPARYFSGDWFRIFVGDEGHKPRILADGEDVPSHQEHLVDNIPTDFRKDFENDMMGSLRDVAGVSVLALHPFIPDREAVQACVRDDGIIMTPNTVDFRETKLSIYQQRFVDPSIERFVHCDLAISGDAAGFACGHVTGFRPVERGQGEFELLPDIYIDALLQVRAPKGGEILLYKVREVIYALRNMGMNIKWVTFDQYQSRDSMQLLRQKNYTVGYQSIDANSMPYDFTKNAIYDGRVSLPRHPVCELELTRLEKDVRKGKVDHPAGFSKDVSDALAGVVYGLTMRRETWAKHGISLGTIPKSIMEAILKKKTDQKHVEAASDAIHTA